MKYVAIFFVALVSVAIADDSCFIDGETLLDGSTVDCNSLYNPTVDHLSGKTICCENEGRTPIFNTYFSNGSPSFFCVC
ncbi:hypothetical protein PoB_003757900 [Plakobranchus ocellatus]|uniref:Secreted protein n=1 Tax=Plakobranchus ocellatus TaxID=259542 RepID=A0AAV4ATE9_9GAST|nr:hypothetical protein PoB_003757900 [Plakobranchus ocellatus]